MVDRPLPTLTEHNRFFWTSGADGKLRFQRCLDCGYYVHPYGPVCPECLSEDLAPDTVSGRGVVRSVTLNHQAFAPGMSLPYAIAIVELEEQRALNLTTNIVGIAPEDVRVDMPVTVTFVAQGEVYLPLFEPVAA